MERSHLLPVLLANSSIATETTTVSRPRYSNNPRVRTLIQTSPETRSESHARRPTEKRKTTPSRCTLRTRSRLFVVSNLPFSHLVSQSAPISLPAIVISLRLTYLRLKTKPSHHFNCNTTSLSIGLIPFPFFTRVHHVDFVANFTALENTTTLAQ